MTGIYQHIGSRFTQIGDQAAGFGTVNLHSFAPNTIGGPLTASTFTFDPELPPTTSSTCASACCAGSGTSRCSSTT